MVSYVGYSLKEPWGEPRVVIGIDADEAEYLAEFLDRDECAQRGQVPLQQVPLQAGTLQQVPLQQVPLQAGTLQPGSYQQPPRPVSPPESPSEFANSALLSAPVSFGLGRHSPDHVQDIAAERAGWNSGELPGQVAEQLAGWPPGGSSDQPPANG
ncbi:MAG: hypothetical protein M3Z75_15635 [Actinomycetota bacterium]|nr:hypothetical protein [Actinomycetota bacterium]